VVRASRARARRVHRLTHGAGSACGDAWRWWRGGDPSTRRASARAECQLKLIRYARVDPEAGTVEVGAGSTWGDVDHATHAFGLAAPSGIISTTGVGGLTLGGGLGHLTRTCGLTIDNLIAADVVLADGPVVRADERQHPDLLWALRGGGGNFGVVTSFVFKAHPIHTDYAGLMLWEIEQALGVMRWYREFIAQAPDDLNGVFAHHSSRGIAGHILARG
jgi:FAD/FMN-containing dehydrogenase